MMNYEDAREIARNIIENLVDGVSKQDVLDELATGRYDHLEGSFNSSHLNAVLGEIRESEVLVFWEEEEEDEGFEEDDEEY